MAGWRKSGIADWAKRLCAVGLVLLVIAIDARAQPNPGAEPTDLIAARIAVEEARTALRDFNRLAVEDPERVAERSADPLFRALSDALLGYVALMPADDPHSDAWSLDARNAVVQIASATERIDRFLRLARMELAAGRTAAAAASLDATWLVVAALSNSRVADTALAQMAELATALPLEDLITAQHRTSVITDVATRVRSYRVLAVAILAQQGFDIDASAGLPEAAAEARDRALIDAARDRLAGGFANLAVNLALAAESLPIECDTVLLEVVARQIAWGADSDDIIADRAIQSQPTAVTAAHMLVAYHLKSQRVEEAMVTAREIASALDRDLALLTVSQWFMDHGFHRRAEAVLSEVEDRHAGIAAPQIHGLFGILQFDIHLSRSEWASALDVWVARRTSAAMASKLPTLAQALAKAGQLDLLNELAGHAANESDGAVIAANMVWAMARAGRWDEAIADVRQIADPNLRAQIAQRLFDEAQGVQPPISLATHHLLEVAVQAALTTGDPALTVETIVDVLHLAADNGALASAGLLAQALSPDRRGQADIQHAMAVAEARAGQLTAALRRADGISGETARARMARDIAIALVQEGRFREALALARLIEPWRERTRAFRDLAVSQARRHDIWGLLAGNFETTAADEPAPLPPLTLNDLISAPPVAEERPDGTNGASQFLFEQDGYGLYRLAGQNVRPTVPAIPDPAMTSLAVLRSNVPATDPGRMLITYLHYSEYNEKFFSEIANLSVLQAGQGTRYPRYIFLESGVHSLPSVERWLRDHGEEDALARVGRIYTLRLPLLIGPNATLVVTDADVEALRMSREAAAYLVNAGSFHLIDSELVGWSETGEREAALDYDTRRDFRPFYLAWSGSRSWIGGSRIAALGYQSDNSYGLSFASGPSSLAGGPGDGPPRPAGILVENDFEALLYGYYAYEADDMMVVGNTYHRSIVYGVYPHDRSTNLVFAYNTVYETEVRHGLIGSREVDGTWWLGNVAFDNRGSGLTIDRDSVDNIAYANLLFDNGQDGLTVFESPCLLAAGNQIFGNGRNGILVRNSRQVGIRDNAIDGGAGNAILAHTKALDDPGRDYALDPYVQAASIAVFGNRLSTAAEPLINVRDVAAVALGPNVFMADSVLSADLRALSPSILRLVPDGVVIVDPNAELLPDTECRVDPGLLGLPLEAARTGPVGLAASLRRESEMGR